MDMKTATAHDQEHPAPQRSRIGAASLAFAILAAPIAWSLQMAVNVPIAAHGCFPADMPLDAPLWANARFVMALVDAVALLVCIAAGLTGWRHWRLAQDEKDGRARELMEGGDGRTRFLSMVAILDSALFAIAVAFAAANLAAVPSCGG